MAEEKKKSRKASLPSKEKPRASASKVKAKAESKKSGGATASSSSSSSSSGARRKARGSASAAAIPSVSRIGKASLSTTRRSRSAGAASERKKKVSKEGYWQGQMLLASPVVGDQRFERSIVYLCHQGEDGALGLVVNKVAEKIQFTDVLEHLNIPFASDFEQISVHVGGPVESSRGFVLHSPEKMFAGTIELGDLAMTASADILKQIAEGKGPKEYVFLLGYAGWGTGQLDKEIERNAWLHLPFDRDLVFGDDNQDKWARAMQKLGVSPHLLSGESGKA